MGFGLKDCVTRCGLEDDADIAGEGDLVAVGNPAAIT